MHTTYQISLAPELAVARAITLSHAGHCLYGECLNPDTPGEPFLLLHGIGSSAHYWRTAPGALFTQLGPCYALHLPGHYPAAFPPDFHRAELSAELMTDLLAELIRACVGTQPATLVGFSTGGFAALALAARYPELAQRVVCISGFAQGRWTGALGTCQQLVQLRTSGLGQTLFEHYYTVGGLSRTYPSVFYQAWRAYAADMAAAFGNPRLRECTDASYAAFAQLDLRSIGHYFAVMPAIDIRSWLPSIRVPTLVLTGDSDPTVPPQQALVISAQVPQARLVVLDGGGHLLAFERPAELERALCGWLHATG